jgi:hypothetical protein
MRVRKHRAKYLSQRKMCWPNVSHKNNHKTVWISIDTCLGECHSTYSQCRARRCRTVLQNFHLSHEPWTKAFQPRHAPSVPHVFSMRRRGDGNELKLFLDMGLNPSSNYSRTKCWPPITVPLICSYTTYDALNLASYTSNIIVCSYTTYDALNLATYTSNIATCLFCNANSK